MTGPGPLQSLVDALARRLDRAVAVDDRSLRLLAYSSHVGPVDEVRKASILTRRAPEEPWMWALTQGIADSDRPMRIPANPDFGMDARIGARVECQGLLLGYLWIIDPDSLLGEEDVDVVAAAAQEAGTILYREQLLGEIELGRERELLRDLLSEDPHLQRYAAGELVEANLFTPSGGIAVLVVKPVHPEHRELPEPTRVALATALTRTRRELSPRHALHLARPDHGLVVVGAGDSAVRPHGLEPLGRKLQQCLTTLLDDERWEVFLGIGDAQQALTDTVTSYRQGKQSVRVARLVRSFGPIVSWSQLGIYRMLSQFPAERLATEALHPGLTALFASSGGDALVETLECYLDLGCDVKAAAATLSLHRASLYYRLHRIEEIADVCIRDGEDRLALHLGLKLARMAGIHPDSSEDHVVPRRLRPVTIVGDDAGQARMRTSP